MEQSDRQNFSLKHRRLTQNLSSNKLFCRFLVPYCVDISPALIDQQSNNLFMLLLEFS